MKDRELQQLKDIRILLMLLLLKVGTSQKEIASALRLTGGRISQVLPARAITSAQIECLTTTEKKQRSRSK
jgi:hypothetical protein